MSKPRSPRPASRSTNRGTTSQAGHGNASQAGRGKASRAGRGKTFQAGRGRRIRVGAAAVGLLIAGVVVVMIVTHKTSPGAKPAAGGNTPTEVASTGSSRLPPWANATDPSAAIRAAGLAPAGSEGSAEHYHAHLDVIISGKPVPVAADVGVDDARAVISPLHTHDTTGVVHVEAPTVGTPFYLGQLFREWDVALSASQLGGLRTDAAHRLSLYVNGKAVSGDPAALRLRAHQEIVLVFGPPGQHVTIPSTYAFGNL